MHRKTSR